MDSQLFADSQAPDFTLIVNNTDLVCSLPLLIKKSLFLKSFIRENPNSDNYETEVDDPKDKCGDYLTKIFLNDQQIAIDGDNFEFLNNLEKKLCIPDLKRLIAAYQYQNDVSEKQIDQNPEILSLHQIEDILINVNSKNFESSLESASSISTSLTELIMARTALAACIARPMSIDMILSFLIQYDKLNETDFTSFFVTLSIHEFNKILLNNNFKNDNRTNQHGNILLNSESAPNKQQNVRNQQEIYYIVVKLIKRELIDPKTLLINNVKPPLSTLVNNNSTENIIGDNNSINIVDHCPLNFVHLLNETQFSEKVEKLNTRSVFYQNLFTLQDNDWNMHKKLLDDGINPNEIVATIRNDDIEAFDPMISSRPSFYVDNEIEESIYERCSPLCKATCFIDVCAFYGSVKCFNFLIKKNAQITPNSMKMAVMGGNLEIIKKCNEMGCRFDQITLLCSIKYHRHDVLKYLLNDINLKFWNMPDVVKYCLKYANFNAFSFIIEKGGNPSDYLIEACHFGNVLAVKWLLDFTGTEVSSESISYGCKSGDSQIVDSLLLQQKDIDLNKPSFITSTAVKPIAKKRGRKSKNAPPPNIALFNQNIDVNKTKSLKDEGFTPLHYACYSNSVEIVEALLKKSGIDVNVKSRENKTPLHISCEYGYDKVAEILLGRKSINVNIKTTENMLPLHFACKSGNVELVRLILKQKKVRSNTKITKGVSITYFIYQVFFYIHQ